MRFTDKVCLVTGGGSGIGRATCQRFAAEGGKVLVIDRNPEGGNETVKLITDAGGTAVFAACDVSSQQQIEAAVQQALTTYGRIDVLVNNAAMMTFDPITDLDPAKWDMLMAVNIRSVFLFAKFCIPHMKAGAIVNISSVHAHQSTPNVLPYAASKGAVEAFTRGISLEYPREVTRCNAIAPGAVDTPMLWSNPNVISGKEKITGVVGKPEELAAAICFLASDDASYVNGASLAVDGGRLAAL